jgi:hypothetical protein
VWTRERFHPARLPPETKACGSAPQENRPRVSACPGGSGTIIAHIVK